MNLLRHVTSLMIILRCLQNNLSGPEVVLNVLGIYSFDGFYKFIYKTILFFTIFA